MATANVNIGVAKAAFFTSLVLSALAGFQSNELSDLFLTPSRIYLLGSEVAMAILMGAEDAL